MPRVRPSDIDIKPGYWVYLNLKKNAIWKDAYSGVQLDVWSRTSQEIPADCDEEDIFRLRRAVVAGLLFVSKKEPLDVNQAQKEGERAIYLRDVISHSSQYMKSMMGEFSSTDIECLHNMELQKGDMARKTVLSFLSKKIKIYASEFAAGESGGGKEGLIENFVREQVVKGERPLKKEPPDVEIGQDGSPKKKRGRGKRR